MSCLSFYYDILKYNRYRYQCNRHSHQYQDVADVTIFPYSYHYHFLENQHQIPVEASAPLPDPGPRNFSQCLVFFIFCALQIRLWVNSNGIIQTKEDATLRFQVNLPGRFSCDYFLPLRFGSATWPVLVTATCYLEVQNVRVCYNEILQNNKGVVNNFSQL